MDLRELSEQHTVKLYNSLRLKFLQAVAEPLEKELKKLKVDLDVKKLLQKAVSEVDNLSQIPVVSDPLPSKSKSESKSKNDSDEDSKVDTKKPRSTKAKVTNSGDSGTCAHILIRGDRKGLTCDAKANFSDEDGNPNCRCSKHKPKDSKDSKSGSKSKGSTTTRKPPAKKGKGANGLTIPPEESQPSSSVDDILAEEELQNLVNQLTGGDSSDDTLDTKDSSNDPVDEDEDEDDEENVETPNFDEE